MGDQVIVGKALNAIGIAGTLGPDDIGLLANLTATEIDHEEGSVIVAMGHPSSQCHLVVEGVACRLIGEEDNRRLTNFLVPGDFIDIHQLFYGQTPFWVLACTKCRIAAFDTPGLSSLITNRPTIARAFWRTTLRDAAIEREWLMNIARRDTTEKIAHLLSELVTRLQTVDAATAIVPLTPIQLAEAAHCDPSEVLSVLTKLEEGLMIASRPEGIVIADAIALRERAGFDSSYLALNPTAKIT